MRRNLLMVAMLVVGMMAMAQVKLTPQAQLSIARQKAKAVRQAAKVKGLQTPEASEKRVRLVVKVAGENAAETFAQMKAVGAVVQGKLGSQAVISLPVDSVDALQRIEGVLRIDAGHKGQFKTDKARKATGVSLLNGPEVPAGNLEYSGKGVNICLIDVGFDFQHAAFKDSEGRSRIKCVYMMGDESGQGHKFTVNDPEAGEITFPGAVYDTPELIAGLTTDSEDDYHGTHTAGIAAGSLSPQGFGGMAPEADLVLIPVPDDIDDYTEEDCMELMLSFVAAYAEKTGKPTVLSASLNSHDGPHDGSSAVTGMIEDLSETVIPVFSAGNEGAYPIHIYQKFSVTKPSIKTIFMGMMDDETGEYKMKTMGSAVGFTRQGDELSVQLSLVSVSMTGSLRELWKSETLTATPGCEIEPIMVSSEDDPTLAKYFDGEVGVMASDYGDGRLYIAAGMEGGVKGLYLFQLTVGGSNGTEVDIWDEYAGFIGTPTLGLKNLVEGDNNMSAGDWTSTTEVISVGAYCTNTDNRLYDGTVVDSSVEDEDSDFIFEANDIAMFSSYGTSFNGVNQPLICAPGVNVVSSVNSYCWEFPEEEVADAMKWNDSPYCAESGTSMSCPAVSGIVALWLQADPTLTLDEVKEVMSETSENDDYTAAEPIRWGYGKINAARGIEYITNRTVGIREVSAEKKQADVLYDLQGRRVSRNARHGIYISKGKKVVR